MPPAAQLAAVAFGSRPDRTPWCDRMPAGPASGRAVPCCATRSGVPGRGIPPRGSGGTVACTGWPHGRRLGRAFRRRVIHDSRNAHNTFSSSIPQFTTRHLGQRESAPRLPRGALALPSWGRTEAGVFTLGAGEAPQQELHHDRAAKSKPSASKIQKAGQESRRASYRAAHEQKKGDRQAAGAAGLAPDRTGGRGHGAMKGARVRQRRLVAP